MWRFGWCFISRCIKLTSGLFNATMLLHKVMNESSGAFILKLVLSHSHSVQQSLPLTRDVAALYGARGGVWGGAGGTRGDVRGAGGMRGDVGGAGGMRGDVGGAGGTRGELQGYAWSLPLLWTHQPHSAQA